MKINSIWHQILLLVIIFMAMIGTTISFPIFAPMFLHPSQGGLVLSSWDQSTRSIFLGIVIAMYPLGQFFGAPILGKLSDNYGRKPAMICSLFCASIAYLLIAFSLQQKSLTLLIVSRLIAGICEGNVAIARSSAADINTNKHRSFGKISAAATAGSILGPILGGLLSDSTIFYLFNYTFPFYFSALLLLLLAVFSFFFFVETLPFDKRSKRSSLKKQYNIFFRISNLGHNSSLKNYLMTWFFVICAIDAFNMYLPAFLSGKWQMSPLFIALFNAMLSIWYVFGSAWLVPYLATKLNTVVAIPIAMLFFACTLALMLIPENSYYLLPIFAICDLSAAVVLVNFFVGISNLTKQEHQGEVMGLAFGLRMLGDAMIGIFGGFLISYSINFPIIFSIIFSIIVLARLLGMRILIPAAKLPIIEEAKES